MNRFGVGQHDMGRTQMIDERIEALLQGFDPTPGDELAAKLSLLVDQLQHTFPAAPVAPDIEDQHMALLMEAAEAVAEPTAEMGISRVPLSQRVHASVSRRVAAATLAFTTAFGAAAYAGVLPAPLQRVVAGAASAVGLELPKPGDDAAGDASDADRDERGGREVPVVINGRADEDFPRPGHGAGTGSVEAIELDGSADEDASGGGDDSDDDRSGGDRTGSDDRSGSDDDSSGSDDDSDDDDGGGDGDRDEDSGHDGSDDDDDDGRDYESPDDTDDTEEPDDVDEDEFSGDLDDDDLGSADVEDELSSED